MIKLVDFIRIEVPTPLWQIANSIKVGDTIARKDFEFCENLLSSGRLQGDADLYFSLAVYYYWGRNDSKAVVCYTKAAEQGHAGAQNNLGYCYHKGIGVEQDVQRAFELYLKAAEQGVAKSMEHLGELYMKGHGVNIDQTKAAEWYTKAAEKGLPTSQFELGVCYQFGYGVEVNPNKAFEFYSKAAQQGNADAQCNLGLCYVHGNGINQDIEKAVEMFTKAAEQGDMVAMKNLGECFLNGWGAEKDTDRAREWFSKANALPEFESLLEEQIKSKGGNLDSQLEPHVPQPDYQVGEPKESFEVFCQEFLSNRAQCKTFAFFGKGKEFEILTTPLTVNIYNSFKSRMVVSDEDGDMLLDQYKNKNEINELIELLTNVYLNQSVTFKLPSIKESAAAQSAKAISSKGVYLVAVFPDFED